MVTAAARLLSGIASSRQVTAISRAHRTHGGAQHRSWRQCAVQECSFSAPRSTTMVQEGRGPIAGAAQNASQVAEERSTMLSLPFFIDVVKACQR